jgi:chemotaxis signal transduction protein
MIAVSCASMIDPTTSEEHAGKSLDSAAAEPAELHDLLPFTIGNQTFAVFANEIETTAEARPVAQLPRAPAAVVGVVCVRGHMITVLDAVAIGTGVVPRWPRTLPFVLVLRGHEQLGLVADTCRETITISAEDIEPAISGNESHPAPALGTVIYAGEAMVILDATRLFRCAVQRRERRRRRF